MKIATTALWSLGLGCFLLTGAGWAAASDQAAIPAGSPTLVASPLTAAPKLDGKIPDAVRQQCVEVRDMPIHADRSWPANETSFRFGYTPDTLYCFLECASLTAKPKMTVREHDGPVYLDDAVELFLEPVVGSGIFYQFVGNALGARYEGVGLDKSWNGAWEAAGEVKEGTWTLVLAIPFATLGIKPVAGMALGFNLTRDDQLSGQLQSWADLGGASFHNSTRFGRLVLGGQGIGAAGLTTMLRDQDRAAVQGVVTNSSGSAQTVRWLMTGTAGAEAFRFEQVMEIPPAGTVPVEQKSATVTPEGWVGWRSMLTAGDTLLYLSPPMRSPFLRLPVLVRKSEPLVLSNKFVRLAFNANSGALVSLRNLTSGREMLTDPEPAPLFRLETVNYLRNPIFFRETDILTLKPTLQTFRSALVDKQGGADVLTVVHQFTEGITVTVNVRLDADDPVSRWEIAVVNTLPRRPRDGAIVHRVVFPLLRGLKAADADADQAVALPAHAGRLVREPGKKLTEPVILEIPGWTSMSWMDLSGPTGGVYIASHDVRPVVQTILEAQGEPSGKVAFSITRWSVLWPGQIWQPQACSVGLHNDDWHWSADRYREWFYATVQPRPAPKWVLAEEGWIMDGGGRNRSTVQNIPRTLTIAKNNGMNYVQSWQHHGHFVFLETLGWYLPNVYGGTEEEFKAAIKDVHRRGGRIGFYFDIGDMETRLGELVNQPQYRQKLSADIIKHMPAADPLSDGWLESSIMNPDGSYRLGWPNGIDTWGGCLGSAKGWGPWYYYCVVTKHAQEYKTDAWYPDILPGYGCGMCFSPNHAHKSPAAMGQITLDFGERVAQNASKDFAILGEGFCDRFFTFQTHALWCQSVHLEDSEPAIFRYTHPSFPLFAETCCYTWGGPSPLYTKLLGLDKVSFADHFRYLLLYGLRFDTCVGPFYDDPASFGAVEKEERDIFMLRKSVHQDLEDADFRDQIGLTGAPAKTQARVFVRRDHTGGLITIFDARPEKAAFTLSLKPARHGLAAITGAEICLPGGTIQALAAPVASGDEVVFQLPKIEARMLIIRFTAQAASVVR